MLCAFKLWELHTELGQQRKEQAQLWRILGTVPDEWIPSDDDKGGWYREAGMDLCFATLQPPGFLRLTVRLGGDGGDVVLEDHYPCWAALDKAVAVLQASRPQITEIASKVHHSLHGPLCECGHVRLDHWGPCCFDGCHCSKYLKASLRVFDDG